MKTILSFLLSVLFITSLSAQNMKTAFINGNVYTVNEKQPMAQSVVIEGNKIIFVGSTEDSKKFIDPDTKVTDLGGKLMLPGFIDNHVHFISGGFYLLGIDLRPANSTIEFRNILRDYKNKYPTKWITGGYWDHEKWEVKELPTKEMIDDITPETPVFVERLDGHMGLANSYELKLAGITKDTESPEGGLIVKDAKTGEPTGVLKDNAMNLIYNVIPAATAEENYQAALAALDEAKKLGITSVQDITFDNALEVFNKLKSEGKLTCRIYTRMPITEYKKLVEKNIQVGYGDDLIKMGSLKAFADGSLGSSTAWFFEKYNQDTTTYGLPMDIITDGNMEKWCTDADKNHLQLSVHAIGDKANSYMLDLYEKISKENPKWDRRFRIDWYVAPLNPLLGLYAAVTRRTLDNKNPEGWIPEQKISIEDAIKCYTINSAYASFEENTKGSIEVGKLADLIVLSDDILKIDPVKIKNAEVVMTIFDGKVIFKK